MNVKLITTAFAGLAISSLSVAEVTLPVEADLYGRINVSLQSSDENNDDKTELRSNASRLGLKGHAVLNESHSLNAIYQIEYEVQTDDGDKDDRTLTQRNTYVGLAGTWGTILGGKHDTPTKMIQNEIDLFSDLEGDIKTLFQGEVRADNIVMYQTPSYANLSGALAVVASEEDDVDDGYSGSLAYDGDSIYVAASYDHEVEGYDVARVTGQYRFGDLSLGALWEEAELSDGPSNSEDGYLLSAAYTWVQTTFKAQWGESDIRTEGAENYSVGVDYKLADSTKVFAFYTDLEDDLNNESSWGGIGLAHTF
jgi:predicted porin